MADEKPATLRDILAARNVEGLADALEELYAEFQATKPEPKDESLSPLFPSVPEGVNRG